LNLYIEKLVVTNQSNRIQCIIVNGQPASISIRRNNKLFSQTYGIHINSEIPPYQFGNFTCHADEVFKSALVNERGKINFYQLYICMHSLLILFSILGYIQLILDYGCCSIYNVSTFEKHRKKTTFGDH